jgi:hypothetical protein
MIVPSNCVSCASPVTRVTDDSLLQDILRQPDELRRVVEYLSGAGRRPLGEAAGRVREARHVYLTGIGSSWHAAQSAHPLFQLGAQPIYLQEASELWQFSSIPRSRFISVWLLHRGERIRPHPRESRYSGARCLIGNGLVVPWRRQFQDPCTKVAGASERLTK